MLHIPALSPGEFRLIYMKNTHCPRGQSVWRKNFRAEKLKAAQSRSWGWMQGTRLSPGVSSRGQCPCHRGWCQCHHVPPQRTAGWRMLLPTPCPIHRCSDTSEHQHPELIMNPTARGSGRAGEKPMLPPEPCAAEPQQIWLLLFSWPI